MQQTLFLLAEILLIYITVRMTSISFAFIVRNHHSGAWEFSADTTQNRHMKLMLSPYIGDCDYLI